ncbi:MAG: hypothetical protein KAV82_00870 [Phycisphaerae bacterium]|nr:hypothetical protein [Phycisphaerae bacterium]
MGTSVGRLRILCFVEDAAHERFLEALIKRLAREEGWGPEDAKPEFRVNRRGVGAVLTGLRSYLHDVRKGIDISCPLVVVLLDGNCQTANARKKEVLRKAKDYGLSSDQITIGVPDPHIERWFLDAQALQQGVDHAATPSAVPYKCERGRYKAALREAFKSTGIIPLFGGVEYARDIVPHLELDQPACGDQTLHDFAHDLRLALRRLKS